MTFGTQSSSRSESFGADSGVHRVASVGESAILVVESERGVMQTLLRFLAGTRRCITAATARDARHHLATHAGSFCGFIIASNLPDGSGMALLRSARELAPNAPALLLAASPDATTANRAYALGGSCILKPISAEPLRRFIADAMASDIVSQDALRRRVSSFAQRYDLTPAAMEILMAKCEGYTREEILELRGVRANTYKTHVRQILRRTSMESLEQVRRAVLAPPAPVRFLEKVG